MEVRDNFYDLQMSVLKEFEKLQIEISKEIFKLISSVASTFNGGVKHG